jgi:hypothetical protein
VIYLAAGFAVAVLLFCGGWAAGRITLHDRRREVADLQATLDRTRRWHDEADAGQHAAGPFPVGPGYLALSDISAGWDAVERQQRGSPR